MGDIELSQQPKESLFHTYDEVIRQRAVDSDQSAVIAYPRLGITDYELFSGRDLNRMVDGAAKSLIKAGLSPVVCAYPTILKRTEF
jgi:hypothetical protein